jgi:hypothetical protein
MRSPPTRLPKYSTRLVRLPLSPSQPQQSRNSLLQYGALPYAASRVSDAHAIPEDDCMRFPAANNPYQLYRRVSLRMLARRVYGSRTAFTSTTRMPTQSGVMSSASRRNSGKETERRKPALGVRQQAGIQAFVGRESPSRGRDDRYQQDSQRGQNPLPPPAAKDLNRACALNSTGQNTCPALLPPSQLEFCNSFFEPASASQADARNFHDVSSRRWR